MGKISFLRIMTLALTLTVISTGAWAACSGPSGSAGRIVFNNEDQRLMYCDGTDWHSLPNSGGGFGSVAAGEGQTAAAAQQWEKITYGNGLFVASSPDGTDKIMTSPDGINWTLRTSDIGGGDILYASGLFVVKGAYDGPDIATSTDGISWTMHYNALPEDSTWWNSMAYGNGLYVAVSDNDSTNQVFTSPDGVNWTGHPAASTSRWWAVAYGNGTFVAVSFSWDAPNQEKAMTSTDGINWTIQQINVGASWNYWNDVTFGNGMFVAVGEGGDVATSPDGVNWTLQTTPEANEWRSVTYGNGLFVAVSDTGTHRMMSSPDGVNWTAQDMPEANSWWDVAYGNGQFVAVSSDGSTRVATAGGGGGPCTSPPRPAGTIIYNADFQVMQYCAGGAWQAMGPLRDGLPSAGLVGHWKLDESGSTVTAVDSSPSGVNGTLTNFASPATSWEPSGGQRDGALAFGGNAVDEKIMLGNPAALQIPSTITMAAWVKPNATQPANNGRIISKMNAGTGDNYGLHIGDGLTIDCRVNNTVDETVPGVVTADVWQHVACTYDGTYKRVYVNGSLIDISPRSVSIPTTGNVSIGGHANSNVRNFYGSLDDVRIYNRALSGYEIARLAGYTGADPTLIAHWKLDEGSGTTASNAAVTADGTLVNDPAWVSGADGSSALSFNGTDQYVDIPAAGLDITDNAISVSAWFKANNTNGLRRIFTMPRGGVDGTEQYSLTINDDKLQFWVSVEGTDEHIDRAFTDTTAWHHLAGTYDGSLMRLYLDGIPVASGNYDGDNIGSHYEGNAQIGRFSGTWGQYFSGLIDDVRVYNRTLTSAEIFQMAKGVTCIDPNGKEGALIYSQSEEVLQYCTLDGWQAVGKGVSGSAGWNNDCAPYDPPGTLCSDGTVYAGLSPDGDEMMFTTPNDAPGDYTWGDASLNDINTAMQDCEDTEPTCETGAANTAFLAGLSDGNSPYAGATYCAGLSAHGYTDWYLPAIDELRVMAYSAQAIGNFDLASGWPDSYYLTSSEDDGEHGLAVIFAADNEGLGYQGWKNQLFPVRCVRKGAPP